jgi:hypothetical protein
VVGKYRTGKSYFLNKILLNKPSNVSGFGVGSTVNACTKGLWLWNQVLEGKDTGGRKVAVLIIDSEGLNSTEVNSNYDNRVFMFCLLLSSLFIYNSKGTIDENALQNINLILNLALKIKIKEGTGTATGDEYVDAFPSFLWVLRDFFLSKEDQRGRKLSSKEYLENALKKQDGMSTTTYNKNRIRKQIKKYFPVRDCLCFVRPVEDEALLKKLDKVKDTYLRPEFLKNIKNARNLIFNHMKPKAYNGQNLSPKLLLELARSYLEAINEHKELNIESSWKYVVRTQANKAKVHVIDLIGRLVNRINLELGGSQGGEENEMIIEWAREAIYGASWEVWKDLMKRRLIKIFRKKCVKRDTQEDFVELEEEINKTVEERLQKLESVIVRSVRNRVQKKIRQYLDPLGVSAIEGELSVDDCKIKLKQILIDYVEQEMKDLLFRKVKDINGVEVGRLDEIYERWIEYKNENDEVLKKAELLETFLEKEREFKTLQRFIEERETMIMEQIIVGKERSMKRMQNEMKMELEEEKRREREQRKREEEREKEDKERIQEQLEELKRENEMKDNTIKELERVKEEWNEHVCKAGEDPIEMEKLRRQLQEKTEELREMGEKYHQSEQKVNKLEIKEELLSNRLKFLTSDQNYLKGYLDDFMLKYQLDREETKVTPDREVERRLSEAVSHLTSRNVALEEKLEKLKNYKTLVRNAASFECKLCYEQILDTEFLEHIKECSTGRSRIIGRSGQLSRGMSTVSVRQGRDIDMSQAFERSGQNTSLHNERGGFYETRGQSQSRVKRRGGSMRFDGSYGHASSQKRRRDGLQGSRSIRSTRRVREREKEEEMPVLRSLVSKHNLQVCLKEKIIPQEIGIEIEHTRVKTPSKESDSPFIFYEIKIFYGDQQSHLVYRKMRDFCSFCIKMEKMYREAGNDLEFLDEFKNAIDRMLKNRTQIQARKKILESFLQDLVGQIGGQSNALFFRFLGLERLKNFESKILENSHYQRNEDTLYSLNVSQQKVLKTMSRNRQGNSNRPYDGSGRIIGKMKPVSIYRTENDQFQIKTREFPERNESRLQGDFYEERLEQSRVSKRDLGYDRRSQRSQNKKSSRGRYQGEDERYLRKLADKKELLMQQSNLLYSQFESETPIQPREEKVSPEKHSQGEAFYEESDESESNSEKDIAVENEGVYGTLLESKENFHTGNEDRRDEPFFESEGNTQNFDIEKYNGEVDSRGSEDEKELFNQTREEKFEEIKQSSRHLKGLQHLKMSTHKQSQRKIRKKTSKPRIYRKKPYAIQDKFKY